MGPEDTADEDSGRPGPPLPPEDRLWRHPSEVSRHGWGPGPVWTPMAAAPAAVPARRAGGWSVVVLAGLAGATLSAALLAAGGVLADRTVERAVVEKIAVTPVVGSPMLRGAGGVPAVAERLIPAVVRLELESATGSFTTGSGVIYRSDGLILTSAELVREASHIVVELGDGRDLDGRLCGIDPLTDVAVVQVEARDLPVAVLGSSRHLAVGEPAIAIASPLGLQGGAAVTTGVISALERPVRTIAGGALHGMIQTDVASSGGSPGGALVDSRGAVVGIITAAAVDAEGRFGFATPTDLARRVADHLYRDGRMVHSWLGIEGADSTTDGTGAGAPGAVVRAVTEGSPADGVGLAADDLITAVDGQEIVSMAALVTVLRHHDPGDEVPIGFWRGDEYEETTVELGNLP